MGARFLVAALALSSIWFAAYPPHGRSALVSSVVRVLGISFSAGVLGKLVGLSLYRWNRLHPRRQ